MTHPTRQILDPRPATIPLNPERVLTGRVGFGSGPTHLWVRIQTYFNKLGWVLRSNPTPAQSTRSSLPLRCGLGHRTEQRRRRRLEEDGGAPTTPWKSGEGRGGINTLTRSALFSRAQARACDAPRRRRWRLQLRRPDGGDLMAAAWGDHRRGSTRLHSVQASSTKHQMASMRL